MQAASAYTAYQRTPVYSPPYYRPTPRPVPYQVQPSQPSLLEGLDQKRKELAKFVTTPRFYAMVGIANLLGLAASCCTRMNIGKMMAGLNATLYLTNAALQT